MDDTQSPSVGSPIEPTFKSFPHSVHVHTNKTPKVERESEAMYSQPHYLVDKYSPSMR